MRRMIGHHHRMRRTVRRISRVLVYRVYCSALVPPMLHARNIRTEEIQVQREQCEQQTREAAETHLQKLTRRRHGSCPLAEVPARIRDGDQYHVAAPHEIAQRVNVITSIDDGASRLQVE